MCGAKVACAVQAADEVLYPTGCLFKGIPQSLGRKRALDADDTCTVYAHLNQPMNPEKMTAEIMEFGYIERYYDRMTGQVKLNDWLQGYGVKIVSDRDRKRGENYQKMFGRSSG